jgi:hypothetical protein
LAHQRRAPTAAAGQPERGANWKVAAISRSGSGRTGRRAGRAVDRAVFERRQQQLGLRQRGFLRQHVGERNLAALVLLAQDAEQLRLQRDDARGGDLPAQDASWIAASAMLAVSVDGVASRWNACTSTVASAVSIVRRVAPNTSGT